MRRSTSVICMTLLLVACRPDTVRISFTPPPNATYRYDVHVRAVTRSTLGTTAPRRSVDDFVLHAEHRVVAAGAHDTELEVRLTIPGVGQRTFTADFDRGAQLSRIQSIEGVPAEALGQLGLSEILPGAAGAPPQRPLAPGDRWKINSPAAVLGGPGSRLRGEGRLVELGVLRGRDVATIESTYQLPVKLTSASGDATIQLDGIQITTVRTVRALTDGAVESAKATTNALYRVTLMPSARSTGAPVTGQLTVEVRSTTARLR
jgi:hypothetical protein